MPSSRAHRSRRRPDDDATARRRSAGSRPWFAALRELARERGLEHLSMGTSQDYLVAVEEGATIVRIGTDCTIRGPGDAAPASPAWLA